MFRLTTEEANELLRSQNVTLNDENLRSHNATLKQGHNIKYLPYAFTEHGAIMAATVLNSPAAVQMSVFVVRAFVKMREVLSGHKELAAQLVALEKKLTDRLDVHEVAIVDILQRIMTIIDPPPPPPVPPKAKIGFCAVNDCRATRGRPYEHVDHTDARQIYITFVGEGSPLPA